MGQHFTDRLGGNSSEPYSSLNLALHVGDNPDHVHHNRQILTEKYGPTVFMDQVHGDEIAIIDAIPKVTPRVDALITQVLGLNLAVLVADCVPLLISSTNCVAAVHVGRRGLVNGITERVLSAMKALGAKDMVATLGPSICGSCYEVSDLIYQEVRALHPRAAATKPQNRRYLDLPRALTSLLLSYNVTVKAEHVCTFEAQDLYSFRREPVTGRQAGLIWL